MSSEYEKVTANEIPRDDQGHALQDIYVHLPSSQKYLRFIAAGDEIDTVKIASLRNHPDPDLYLKKGPSLNTEEHPPDPEIPREFQEKILGKALQKELDDIYVYIAGDTADPAMAVQKFESISDSLVATIAPDVKALSDHLKKQAQYLALMSDSAAISTLAILCAFANGFDSRKSYRELSYATLVMDISMTEFSPEEIKLYYQDRNKLPHDVLKKMELHPMRSYQLAEQKLKSLSDVTMQLILNHHELYNGKGFPRNIRTEALFPIARVLSLAVDAFERLKRAEIMGEKKGLLDILIELRDEAEEAHLRRHNKKFVDATISFLSQDGVDIPTTPSA